MLNNIFRFLDGVADAASWGSLLGILMTLYPDKVAVVMSYTELFFGLGYTIGKIKFRMKVINQKFLALLFC